MSRPIKFRAYQKTPSLNHKPSLYEVTGLDFYEGDYGGGEVCLRNKKGEQWTEYIKDVVLEQFTGLLDRNGKEIYEGDIVSKDSLSGEYGALFVVKYGGSYDIDIGGHHYCPFIRGFYLDEICEYDKVDEDGYMEVIGNVHEDKELLGGEE